jgi:hypothetical protein
VLTFDCLTFVLLVEHRMLTRGLTLASVATGDVASDIEWLIIDQLFPPHASEPAFITSNRAQLQAKGHRSTRSIRQARPSDALSPALQAKAERVKGQIVRRRMSPAHIADRLRKESGKLVSAH